MSHFGDLIAELCPSGVRFEPLWQLTSWDKRFNAVDRTKQPRVLKYNYLLASDLRPLVVQGGDIKLLTTNSSDLWTTEEIGGAKSSVGEIVAIPWGGNPNVQYYKGRFFTADNRIAIANDSSKLSVKYLYYFLKANLSLIGSFYRGSGIKHPSMSHVLDMRIPVPPLEVQQEIVRILDQFTQLEAELEAELEARRSQFTYYRDLLLKPKSDWDWLSLREVATDFGRGKSKHRPRNDPRLYGGPYAFIQTGDVRASDHRIVEYSQTYSELGLAQSKLWPKGTICITIAANIAETGILAFEACFPDSVIGMVVNSEKASAGYVEYLLQSHKSELVAQGKGSAQANINLATFEEVRFPFPNLHEQNLIVDALDKFDALANDLTIGLPAELAARRKQYEYYRDRLLTFEEAMA